MRATSRTVCACPYNAAPPPQALTPTDDMAILDFPLWLRATHFLNLLFISLLVRSGFTEREALLASSTFHTHLLGRLALSTQVGHDRRGHEPRWNAHGLGAADYERHGLETIVAGLRSLHDTVNP